MSRWIDTALAWLKWPAAVWVALSIPRLAQVGLELLLDSLDADLAPFWLGVIGYLLVWGGLLRRRAWGSFLPTLLHELTHGLFAVLTFHRILSLRATWSSGGEIEYTGPGNWLITISPYFFPLAILLAVPLLELLQPEETVRLALLGVVFGFESAAMWRQVHRQQPDLHKVGLVFTAVFLPGALLWTYGSVLTLVLRDSRAMLRFVQTQWRAHWRDIDALVGQGIALIS